MPSFALAAVLQVSMLSTSAQTYAEAHRQHLETGRPLVVLVGADWCPACRTMKQSVIPQAQRQGVLNGAAFAQINTDQQPELARKLMSGGSIPQLIIYHKSGDTWRRKDLTGAQSVTAIQQALTPPSSLSKGTVPTAVTPRIGR